MAGPVINTPRGKIVVTENGKAELTFNPNFRSKWQGNYTAAQKFVDSEILRLSEPYVPLLTGTLIASGILGTKIGSGEVSWIAPYARRQYYSPRKAGSATGPQRGPYWFARMKAVSGKAIIAGARKIAGRGQ
jgi:hypothetical protein